MEALARGKFLPMFLASGAQSVQMIRTGDLSFSVMTNYADACAAAQAKIAQLRAEAKSDLPMTMESVSEGPVFAAS